MRENLKKRLDMLEGEAGPTKPMVICCPPNGNVEELVAEWKSINGAPSDGPLIIVRDVSGRPCTE